MRQQQPIIFFFPTILPRFRSPVIQKKFFRQKKVYLCRSMRVEKKTVMSHPAVGVHQDVPEVLTRGTTYLTRKIISNAFVRTTQPSFYTLVLKQIMLVKLLHLPAAPHMGSSIAQGPFGPIIQLQPLPRDDSIFFRDLNPHYGTLSYAFLKIKTTTAGPGLLFVCKLRYRATRPESLEPG